MNKLIAVVLAWVAVFSLLSATCAGVTTNRIWSDDSVPDGAVQLTDGRDAWNWVGSNPTPVSGSLAHQSNLLAGQHEHFFNYATTPLTVAAGDVLFAYVYLDPANPPSELMVRWHADNWEHRACAAPAGISRSIRPRIWRSLTRFSRSPPTSTRSSAR